MIDEKPFDKPVTLDTLRRLKSAGEKIACDTLVMWGERGVVHPVPRLP